MMNSSIQGGDRAAFAVWAFLLVATAITWWLGDHGMAGQGVVITIMVLALIKGLGVALEFMELKGAPPLWRRVVLGWLLTVTGLILLTYWMGTP